MRKQAIAILAHNNKEILKMLIETLDSEYFDLFIHADLKSDINEKELKKLVKKSNLYFYKELNIKWGGISIAQGEYLLLNKIIEKNNNYEYIHIISGVDFPLKSNKEIYTFFHKNLGKEFIHYQADSLPKVKEDWTKLYRFFPKNYRKYKFIRAAELLSQKVQKLVGVNRIKHSKIKYMTGANWVSITEDLARYLLSKEEEFNKTFKYCHFPEELFIQTYVEDSPFKDKLYDKTYSNDHSACKRQIDWSRGNPYTYKLEDYDELINCGNMFARKFDSKNIDIVKKLYEKLKKEN
ncbi:hypothetical protein J6X90_00215 [Candidatus Saccharibacteria bacterium]|nr:hypothetical protein [Candidatus Saccharibacteria bacterium]